MKTAAAITLVSLALLSPAAGVPQQRDLELVMRLHRAALGGMDALLSFPTARLTFDLTINGRPAGTQVNTYGGGGLFRYVREGERWGSASFDGQTAYSFNGSTRRARAPHGPGGSAYDRYLFQRLRAQALLFPLMEAQRLGARLSVESGQGRLMAVVTAFYPDGLERTFDLDNQGRLARDSFSVEAEGIRLTVVKDYLDYRRVRGAYLPGRTLTTISGTVDFGGGVRPVDLTEALVLKRTEPGADAGTGFFVPGKPEQLIEGTSVAAGGLRFLYSGTVPTGDDPESIRAADLNGDGHVDLVTGDDGGISFLAGDGSGRFPTRLALPGGGGSNEFVLPADLDGDGNLDLAVASTARPPSTLFVSLGLGRGRFAGPKPFETGDFPEAIAAADFDGDDNLDLALAHNRSGDARLFFGDGNGDFGGTLVLALGGRGENLAVADLNGDARPDLLVVDQKKLTVFLNAGGRAFEAGIEYGAGPLPFCVAAADFDGDGAIDVLVGNGGIFADQGEQDLALLRGNGDGTLKSATFISAGGSIASVDVADFDGDGLPDAVAASFGTHECWVLHNIGGELTPAGPLPCSWSPVAVVAADLNGDGAPDIAVANEYGDSITIWMAVNVRPRAN